MCPLFLTLTISLQSDGKLGKMIPLISYAVITITVGVCSIRLPETNNRKLMETVAEVEIK